jgi:hypothetical protein
MLTRNLTASETDAGKRSPARVRLSAAGVVTVVCFLAGGLWYSPLLFGNTYMELRGIQSNGAGIRPSELIAEIIRCFVLSYTFAYFILRLGIDSVKGALRFAFLVWIGFQAFVLIGSVIHEAYSIKLFLIHAGDALLKAVINCILLMLWHKRTFI